MAELTAGVHYEAALGNTAGAATASVSASNDLGGAACNGIGGTTTATSVNKASRNDRYPHNRVLPSLGDSDAMREPSALH